MAKFVIQCSTTVSYHLVVEAPSEEAARIYYEGCDASEFHKTDELGWQLDDIYQDEYGWGHDAAFTVNEEGEII